MGERSRRRLRYPTGPLRAWPQSAASLLAPDGRNSEKSEGSPLAGGIGRVRDEKKIKALRRKFWREHPEMQAALVMEATWDASPEAGLSDGGRDRPTLWFRLENCTWMQLWSARWQNAEI